MKKPPLTHKKAQWLAQRKSRMTRGAPLSTNAGVSRWYRQKLERLTRDMVEATEKEILRLFEAEGGGLGFAAGQDASIASQGRILLNALRRKISSRFADRAQDLAHSLIRRTDKASSAAVHASLAQLSGGLSVKSHVTTGPMREAMKAAITENVGLIRSIPAQYLEKVEFAVMRSISGGSGLQSLIPAIEKAGKVSRNRARAIALDQSKKAATAINSRRMQALGVNKFEWLHSGASQEPREFHQRPWPDGLNGGIFDLNDPPAITEDGTVRGLPGDLIGCNCKMMPVIDFSGPDDDPEGGKDDA